MELVAWFVFGAVSGYLAGLALFEDSGVGVNGHVVVGSIAGIVGGYLAALAINLPVPADTLHPLTLVAAITMAVVSVVLVNAYAESEQLRV